MNRWQRQVSSRDPVFNSEFPLYSVNTKCSVWYGCECDKLNSVKSKNVDIRKNIFLPFIRMAFLWNFRFRLCFLWGWSVAIVDKCVAILTQPAWWSKHQANQSIICCRAVRYVANGMRTRCEMNGKYNLMFSTIFHASSVSDVVSQCYID